MRWIATLLTALGVLLGACRKAEVTAPAGGEASSPAVAVTYDAADYRAKDGGRPGGTLRISTASDTPNLDPHGVSSVYIQWFGRLVFDNLVYLDAQGEPTPWLAKSWTVSADGRTYTFQLREDVTFSDGSRFDAEALQANFEHMRDPATRSPLAARYIAPYVSGRVVAPFTFEATLREPYQPFLSVLAQSWLAILSPRQIRENPRSILQHPVGSGPFVLESYTRQQGLRLQRRADYHWAPPYLNHTGPAFLERIEIDIIPEALIRFSGLTGGQYDFTLEAPAQNAAALRADSSLVVDKRIRQGIPNRAISFNTTHFPFDDVRVRRALALGIDREGIVQIVGFGEFPPKADFLAANTRFYDPAFAQVLAFDPAEATRLLDEAGWSARDAEGYRVREGRRLSAEFLTTEAATPSPVVVAVQADARKIGFEIRVVQLPQTQLADRRLAGQYDAITGGVWHTNTPDALYILHHSDEITTPEKIGQNVSRLSDPELDQLLTQARAERDEATLRSLYSRAQQRLTELVPAVPVYENFTLTAHHRRLQGVLYDTSHNTPIFVASYFKEEGQ